MHTKALMTAVIATGAIVAGAAEAQFARTAGSGQSLVVPQADSKKGTIYHTLTDGQPQVFFSSEAPFETISGQSSRVIGYTVAGPSASPADLQGGEWQLPVESLRTGIRLRDSHLAGDDWFNASDYPNIVFRVHGVDSVQLVNDGEGFQTFTGTLVGEMTIAGVTRSLQAEDSTFTFLTEGPKTEKIAKGDLLAIRAKYQINLGEFGIKNRVIGQKVAEEVEIDTTLYLATVEPEMQ